MSGTWAIQVCLGTVTNVCKTQSKQQNIGFAALKDQATDFPLYKPNG